MKKAIALVILVNVAVIAGIQLFHYEDPPNLLLDELKVKMAQRELSGVDHSQFEILQQQFASPQEVTAACISCHTEHHKEVMESFHWSWEQETYVEGRGVLYLGKKTC
ncbi:MAG: hypothetical protein OHK0039_15080 [Bacteroidia bacterium]